jgi:hypothetical protein
MSSQDSEEVFAVEANSIKSQASQLASLWSHAAKCTQEDWFYGLALYEHLVLAAVQKVVEASAVVWRAECELSQVWYRVQEAQHPFQSWQRVPNDMILADWHIVQSGMADIKLSDLRYGLSQVGPSKNLIPTPDLSHSSNHLDFSQKPVCKHLAGVVEQCTASFAR